MQRIIEEWLAGFADIQDAVTALETAGVPAAKVLNTEETTNYAPLLQRGSICDLPTPNCVKKRGVPCVRARGPWHRFSKTPLSMGPAPSLGEHNDEILSRYGMCADEIAALQAKWS